MLINKFRRMVLQAGSAIIGKVRLVDSGGSEVTDGSEHAIRATLVESDAAIGAVSITQLGEGAIPLTNRDIAADLANLSVGLMGDGRKTVAAAGTAEAMAASTACKWVIITAETDNTDKVVIGASTVVAALATRRGIPLDAGDSVVLVIDNLADIYVDALVNGEGVTYAYGA